VNLNEWRRLVRLRAKGLCERCGAPEPEHHIHHAHHADRDKSNNVLSNGEYLCAQCHNLEHLEELRTVLCGREFSAETRTKIGEKSRSREPWNKGRTHVYSAEALTNLSAGQKRRLERSDERERLLGLRRGKPLTDGHRAKLRESSRSASLAAWAPGGARRIAQERRNHESKS
jgi:HNH endonuclease